MAVERSTIDEISDDYVAGYAALNPTAGVGMGLADPPPGLSDYGPDGSEARAELSRALLRSVAGVETTSDRDRVAVASIHDRLGIELEQHDAGEWMRELRVFGSPPQATQQVFELLPHSTASDWESVADRMAHVPRSIESFAAALRHGVASGIVSARRQALACAKQASTTADGYFRRYVAGAPEGVPSRPLEKLAGEAESAFARLADYLSGEYALGASDSDAVGRERYELACRRWTGVELDLEETYRWGWEDLERIQSEMASVADEIAPGEGVDGAIELLENDPARCIYDIEELVDWLQELMDTAVAELASSHFDIPEAVRTVEAMIAPAGSAGAMYYTRPSEDFTRPGRTWYPNLGGDRYPKWVEVSTAYHEGVPGHHLQLGYTTWLGNRLNSFQRHRANVSGHTEGWALYAERLMGELGYLENPDYMLGMLAGQAHRATRIIVDIGMHLQLAIPPDTWYHPGERWTPELAVPFMVANGRRTQAFMASEVDRYLGWPAQAISYKVGERVWLTTRDRLRRRDGSNFDLKRFHQRAFELGLVGLAQFEAEMLR